MKKTMVFALLFSMFVLGGCRDEDDWELPDLPAVSSPKNIRGASSWKDELATRWANWDSFTFKSLTGKEDLVVSRGPIDGEKLTLSTSKYSGDILVVAVLSTDCASCKKHVAAFDKLAAEFVGRKVDFAIIFTDVFDAPETQRVYWIESLTHVDSYSNVETACSGGACTKILGPLFTGVFPGTVYYIDKQDLIQTGRGITWKEEEDSDEVYAAMEKEFVEALHLQPITFDVNVANIEDSFTETSL